jgi:hypothetical protein
MALCEVRPQTPLVSERLEPLRTAAALCKQRRDEEEEETAATGDKMEKRDVQKLAQYPGHRPLRRRSRSFEAPNSSDRRMTTSNNRRMMSADEAGGKNLVARRASKKRYGNSSTTQRKPLKTKIEKNGGGPQQQQVNKKQLRRADFDFTKQSLLDLSAFGFVCDFKNKLYSIILIKTKLIVFRNYVIYNLINYFIFILF